MKSLQYAYPYSPNASRILKAHKYGGWYITIDGNVSQTFPNGKGVDSRWIALAAFEDIPEEVDLQTSFTRNNSPFACAPWQNELCL